MRVIRRVEPEKRERVITCNRCSSTLGVTVDDIVRTEGADWPNLPGNLVFHCPVCTEETRTSDALFSNVHPTPKRGKE